MSLIGCGPGRGTARRRCRSAAIIAGERDRAADLMCRHIELRLLSLGPAGVARADDGIRPA
jgi:hypothetical protein